MNVVIADDINEPDEIIAISLTKITPFLTLTSVDGEILVTDDDGEEETAIDIVLYTKYIVKIKKREILLFRV